MGKRLLGLVLVWMLLPLAAQDAPPRGPVHVGEPAIPTISPAVRDLPDLAPNPNMYGLEMKRREDFGFIPTPYPIEPKVDPLLELNMKVPAPAPDAFSTPLHTYTGMTSPSSPPDDTGDVGPTHFLQGINSSGAYSTSTVGVFSKATGTNLKTFSMQSLASGSPCSSGYCDPIVLYDRMADRWMIAEFPSSGGHLCVYVSTTPDPTGTWYAYAFMNVEPSTPDYPKYGVWPQNGNGGSYFVGINAGATGVHDVVALDRAKMLAGQPATYQKFTVPDLPNSGFQLVLPANQQGKVAPPNGSPAIVMRPRDDEAQDGANTPTYDLLEMWAISVDWATPASSTITQLPSLHMADYDMTLCGMGDKWNCMPQPGTSQKIDPIREPVHFPLQYRNFGDHESVVGCFVEDVDGTDHAALRWFEVRKTGGVWSLYQEGVVGGEANVHRSVGSASIDGSGNIAMGYTRTGTAAPYYPSIYYKGRLSSDPLGTMPQGEYVIQDATTSNTDNQRWGDYAGIGVDPVDDCTFWFTTEYGGSGQTKIASFKFDACGCLSVPVPPAATISAPAANRIDVSWDDSTTGAITRYFVYRSLTAGGPYTILATVPDTSPGVGGGAAYTFSDNTVSGGTTYYYTVKSNDGAACTSPASNEVSIPATGLCIFPPSFAGLISVTNPAGTTCTLNLSWSAGTPACAGPVKYNIYRSTSAGFAPGPSNRIAQNVSAASYSDLDSLVSATTYYYVVRAVDSGNSVEETNTEENSGKPTGPYTEGTWSAGAEAGDPAMIMASPWTTSTTYKRTGTYSYSTGAAYPTSVCTGLTTPSLTLGTGPVLTYFHIYSTETGYDGGRVEISTNGGGSWTALTPTPPYGGTITSSGNSCSWPTGTACYIGTSTGYPDTWQSASIDLSAYNGRTILLRWDFTTDSSGAGSGANPGWYVDDIQVTHVQVLGSCATGSACANNPFVVDVTPDGPLTACGGAAQILTCTPTGGTGVTYQWYDNGSPIDGATSSTYAATATGTHSYNCKATGSGCSSGLSDAAATAITWQAAPTFAGLASVSSPSLATCSLDLSWPAGTSPCAGGVTYNIYRSTAAPVNPAPGNRIASGLAATSYRDQVSLANGTTYYYVVRAANASDGSEETNTAEKSGVPYGPVSTQTLTDTFEGALSGGGFDLAGWTHSYTPSTGNVDWAWSTAQVYDGAHSWFSASQTTATQRSLVSPSFGVISTTTMSFYHTYEFEDTSTCYDGGTLEYTTDGSTWTVVPDADFTAGGFNGTAYTSYSNPIGGKRAWCFGTIGSMTPVFLDLGGDVNLVNRTVQIRWREGDDSSSKAKGWYVDHVVITNAGTATACATGSVPPGETAPGDAPATAQSWTDKTTHTWPANATAATYTLYRGVQSDLPQLLNASTDSCTKTTGSATSATVNDDPGAVTGRFYWYLVTGSNSGGEGTPGSATAGPRIVNSGGACP